VSRLTTELQAVTTPVHVISVLLSNIENIPNTVGVTSVMSPDLELIPNINAQGAPSATTNDGAIVTWNRTAINTEETSGLRLGGSDFCAVSEDGLEVVVGTLATFTLNWRFYASNMATLEEFELLYAMRMGINSNGVITVATTNLGAFEYTIDWNPIQDLAFSLNTQFLSYLEGTAKVTGVFTAKRSVTAAEVASKIQAINSTDTTNNEVLSSVHLVPLEDTYADFLTRNNLP